MPLDPAADCTVCIPTYSQAEYLRAAIESVVQQTAPVRLLVANDASPDHTATLLAELQSVHSFQVQNHRHNLGISANLAWLLLHAETPYVVRLDSDDLLHPEFVLTLRALLERFPAAGYAHCAVQEIGPAGEGLGTRRLARKEPFQDAETALRRSVMGYQVTANVLLFRKAALMAAGDGPSSPELNFVEDYDLSVRLADAGWGNVYSSEVLASYRMWAANSRPVVGRKLREVDGVRHIFTGSLHTAFARRGWPLAPLARRRRQLALANAEVLDRGSFAPAEREAMVQGLLALGGSARSPKAFGSRALAWALGAGALPSGFRRLLHRSGTGQQRVKRWIKAVLFRR